MRSSDTAMWMAMTMAVSISMSTPTRFLPSSSSVIQLTGET
jgi:hypothetical protein